MQALRDDVESLTKMERSLRDRIIPATERELSLQTAKGNAGGHDDGLQAAVVAVMNSIIQMG